MSGFGGFSSELPVFLAELRDNNRKEWFDANRKRYEALYLEPAKEFVAAIGPGLQAMSPAIAAEPRVNGAIMRVNRDIRFSKDKTPYKTTLDMHFLEGATRLKSNPAFLFRLSPDAFNIGAGAHGFTKAQLQSWRDALVDAAAGPAFADAVTAAAKAGYGNAGGGHYKTVPKGYPADHPNVDYLRFNMFYLTKAMTPPDALFGPGAVDYCLGEYRAVRPVHAWLVDHVADRA